VATALAHGDVADITAAGICGHSQPVFQRFYSKAYKDSEERSLVLGAMAKIGFGQAKVADSVADSD
jgi:hypothetical protein